MKNECCGFRRYTSLLCLLLVALIVLSGCTNAEKAKAEHVSRGEAYLKDSKFQEASLEFRNAIQIDGNLGAALWGLARAYEGLQRYPEMIDELRKTLELDKTNQDARIKLGNYYLAASMGRQELVAEADRLAKEALAQDENNIEAHILMGSIYFARNDKDKAFAELNRAVELNPNRVESYLSMARFYQREQQSRGVVQESDFDRRQLDGGPFGVRQVPGPAKQAAGSRSGVTQGY
jgi:tetratricopeptide (TPR) repeat protein